MKKNKKLKSTALFLTGLIATSAIVSPILPSTLVEAESKEVTNVATSVPKVAATKSIFKDLSSNYVYLDIIQKMNAQGIISGYEDKTFRPNETLSRKHAAALVNRAVTLAKPESTKKAPKDLSTKNPNYNDLMALYQAGLLDLDSKGNINPNAKLTRGEMAKILAVAFDLEGKSNPFTDVSKAYAPYVNALYENDVTTGFEDNTFKENQSLTRSHFAVFMYRAMEHEEVSNEAVAETDISKFTEDEVEKFTQDQIVKSIIMFNEKYEKTGVPLPVGETDRKAFSERIYQEYATFTVQNAFNGVSTIPSHAKDSRVLEMSLDNIAKYLEISLKDVIVLMNETVENGIVKSNENYAKPFVMYFDYVENKLIFSAGQVQN